ncbi:DJ-1 family glyoxalase III [Teredinibacter turnerae]|uniref:DJ-1 family glyoxalase III n=1 Tax=Teredinibacter turnerae TaxID=2426 RepID=UPI000370D228|nr:DJ-1 family glyoxalase III [Teredinibacter turnerae]
MANVLVPIADGSEEIEAVTIIDVLVRAGAEVTVASVMERTGITASRGVKLDANCLIESCGQDWDLIALPGGLPGADHLAQSAPLMALVRHQLAEQRLLAAICAAPAVVLGRHGLLADRVATCYPGFQGELASQARTVSVERVVEDGNLITSQGPGTAMEFSLALVTRLFGTEKATAVANGLLSR